MTPKAIPADGEPMARWIAEEAALEAHCVSTFDRFVRDPVVMADGGSENVRPGSRREILRY